MQLDFLSIDWGLSRWAGAEANIGLRATVVPADWDSISIGPNHAFTNRYGMGGRTRIEATLWISANPEPHEHVNALLAEKRTASEFVGYGSVIRKKDPSEDPDLSFVLFLDAVSLQLLIEQMQQATIGNITANVGLDGLKFGLPDEDIWPLQEDDGPRQYLPVRQFSIDVGKLRTTRSAISNIQDHQMYDKLADSDDKTERSQATQWIGEAVRREAEDRSQPLLSLARQIRVMLAILIILVILAILKTG